jgi:polyisoprenyl-teichoic acid--peptidoglycan teichoic acid transferase
MAAVLVAAACSRGSDTTTTVATTAPPTTVPATTTTTTTTAPETHSVTGDVPPGLGYVVATVYDWMSDHESSRPSAPARLLTHLRAVAPPASLALRATSVVADLPEGDQVAVVHVGRDVWYGVDSGGGWRVVGAHVAGATPWLGDEPRTLLVIGSDARVGEDQLRLRADSIHVLTLAPTLAGGTIVGFPRDSWLDLEQIIAANEVAGLPESEVPTAGTKWTNLMASRGPEIMLGTAEVLTDTDLEGYVITGFKGFEGLMSFLGELIIELPTTMRTGNTWDDFAAGLHVLSPNRALELARIRKGLPRGDFDRSLNQGRIMLAAMAMVQDMGVDAVPGLLSVLLEHAWTDLDTEPLFTIALAAFTMDPEDVTNMVLDGSIGTVAGSSVVFLNEDTLAAVFADISTDGVVDEPDEP